MGEIAFTPLEREALKKFQGRGGKARARNLTKEELRAIGLMGVAARLKKSAKAKREAASGLAPLEAA